MPQAKLAVVCGAADRKPHAEEQRVLLRAAAAAIRDGIRLPACLVRRAAGVGALERTLWRACLLEAAVEVDGCGPPERVTAQVSNPARLPLSRPGAPPMTLAFREGRPARQVATGFGRGDQRGRALTGGRSAADDLSRCQCLSAIWHRWGSRGASAQR